MRTKSKQIVVMVLAAALGIIAANGQGFIVPNGVTFPGLNGVGAYETRVLQHPTTGDYTGFWLTPQNQTTFAFDGYVDEGVRVFRVSSLDPISVQAVQANNYQELTVFSSYSFPSGVPFFLGVYTGYGPWDTQGNYTGIYRDPLFGWGRFVNNNGVIQMLSSALEYGGAGIYAGTQVIIPIPEPSALSLVALSGVLVVRRRSWKSA